MYCVSVSGVRVEMRLVSTYPCALSEAVEAKLVSDLGGVHGVLWVMLVVPKIRAGSANAYGQILLVGEDQEKSIPELVLVQHALQLLASLDDTIAIVAVNDEDDTLGVLEVMPPQRTDLVLASDIPHSELDVLVLDGLDIETCTQLSACARVRDVAGMGTHQWWGWW